VAYLRSVLPSTTEDAFFDYLATLDASEVTVSAVPGGSIVFPRPYSTLLHFPGSALKLMEIGLRRAQGPDGALSASKYSYIGGFDYTSNVLAGKLYGIPVCGTIAHSFIMSFTSLEEVQLRGLLDTYCVRRSGLPNFCAVALALHQLGYRAIGVRLDSGDLAQQSKEIRRVLRACGAHFQVPWFETIPIAVSNDISEQSLEEFSREGSEIDMIGVGTNLVTCPLQPSLGCVYK
ncbi:PREDICTED: nicotinate phosphoribosyltransferase, partial [Fulmarus glacialis]|uniref:nicotinate phosphoribosyltransferase n=1 Tax=Fulmarus glacialis TaxID=30455 RepID=UPI00051CAA6C